ncbi:mask [Symbiodinium sp. CCMP2592]|nr:mask [Symbiodinium sp. CCMP2592]
MIRVVKLSGDELAKAAVEDVGSVRDLKLYLQDALQIPEAIQQLMHDGCILDDDAALDAPSTLQLILSRQSQTAVDEALVTWCCRVDLVRMLLVHGADKDSAIGFSPHQTVLMIACAAGSVETVQVLLEAGANKDLQDSGGYTALIRTCNKGHVEIARMLLEAGANKDLQSDCGGTALSCACNKGHVEIERMLLEAGADKQLPNCGTALTRARDHGRAEIG